MSSSCHHYVTKCNRIATVICPTHPAGAPPSLVHPNPQNVSMACQWVQMVEARGTTDILTPYQVASSMLLNADGPQQLGGNGKAWAVSPSLPTSNIPVIFLITDGAVYNEHDICQYAQQQALEWQKTHTEHH